MKELSVIVPMHRTDYIDEILASYAVASANSCDETEVLFGLTNSKNSKELTDKILVFKDKIVGCKVVELHGQSNCESRNSLAKIATGNRLLFVDGDQLVSSQLFEAHIIAIGMNQVGIGIMNIDVVVLNGKVHVRVPPFKHERRFDMWVNAGLLSLLDFTNGLYPVQATGFAWFHNRDKLTDYINVVTRNCSIWKEDFEKIGGFDVDLGYSEKTMSRGWDDTEIGIRAHEDGMEFVFVPAWTVHPGHQEMCKDGGLGNVITMTRKHSWFIQQRPEWYQMHGYDVEKVRKECGI
jgi:predicted glycosyltransferase involved in capsule biosynthesis